MYIIKDFVPVIITLTILSGYVILASADLWPSGEYSLPKPKSGCPRFWKEGWLRQDMEDEKIHGSNFSSNFHMDATLDDEFLKRRFCTKDKVTYTYGAKEDNSWPKGFYCIYKRHRCPRYMVEGWIYWDDEDSNNENSKHGSLPDLDVSRSYSSTGTKLYYCCQKEGTWYKSIELPIEKPFYLLPYGSRNCQRVMWAVGSLEYIVYDTEDNDNRDNFHGHHVFSNKVKSLPKIFYCYYESCQYKLSNNHGSFTSANILNSSYPDFQYCSWSIKINESERISLKFHTLYIPNCEENYLDIYDGDGANASNIVVNGSTIPTRFCGENATAGTQLTSKTNKLYIVLKSGNNSGINVKKLTKDVGFYAEYDRFLPEITTTSLTTSPTTMLIANPTTYAIDNGKIDIQNSNKENSANYLSIVLPILAILILLGVVGGILYLRRRNRKKAASTQMEQKPNQTIERHVNHTPSASSTQAPGPVVALTTNPIYDSAELNSVYENDYIIEMYNATDNVLYEPGNEAFEGNPIYGLEDDVDSTYTEPLK